MPFPQGGDFVRDVTRDFSFVASDPERDQGDGLLYASDTPSMTAILAGLSQSLQTGHPMHQLSKTVQSLFSEYVFSTEKEATTFLAQLENQVASSAFVSLVSSTQSSFWRMAQFNPGVLPHWPNTYSDLYAHDVFSSFTTYNRLIIHFIETLAARFKETGDFDYLHNLVSTDYYTTISGSESMCIGDEEPPFITYVEPTLSGAHVRPRDQIVEFTLTDEVGGVDLSTVFVDVTSTTTTGTIPIVANGADQTGGYVAVIGDASSYRFRYTPPFQWDYNDIVTVTISGADFAPQVDGNPFFCDTPEVNYFVGDIPFQVLNEEYLGATLNVIGDVDPPYISLAIPASGTTGNNVFAPVVIQLSDDLTGTDLASISVVLDSKVLVSNGVPTTGETTLVGTPDEYQIFYTPDTAFAYGTTSTVTVSAQDRVETGPPNAAVEIYDFSFIEDSTLIIENFEPDVGTHHNLDNVDIQVDVRDDAYGVNEDQTFFVINGTIVSGTRTTITSGIRMTYHPPNDFAFDEPIRVTVHGTNDNVFAPVVKETFQTLFYGCRILFFNNEPFVHADNVSVYVRARNLEEFHKDLSSGYFFSTYTQPSADLGASIEAINPQADLPATLNGLGPEHRYGETVTVEFSVEDLNGHLLGPYIFVYTIEDKPD